MVAVLLALGAAAVFKFAAEADRMPIVLGLVVGAIATLVGSRSTTSSAAKVAWGVAFGSMAHLFGSQPGTGLAAAMLAGAGIASAIAGCSMTALMLAVVVVADRIGGLGSPSAMMPLAGSVFGLSIALSAVVSEVDKKNHILKLVAAIGLPLVLGYLVTGVWLKDASLASCAMLGVGAGAVLHFLVSKDEAATSLTVGIASVISVGLATVAAALALGTGMAFSLMGAVSVLGILGNRKALLTLGPLFGLVMFRIFRTIYPETARAFDIGQHYALIGLLLGAILPLLLVDWDKTRKPAMSFSIAALLWGAVVIVATPALMAFLGAYGTVGLLIGAGLAGVIEALRGGSSTKALGVSVGMGGIVLLTYGWMASAIDMTREDKVRVLIWAIVAIVILVAGIFGLSRQKEVK